MSPTAVNGAVDPIPSHSVVKLEIAQNWDDAIKRLVDASVLSRPNLAHWVTKDHRSVISPGIWYGLGLRCALAGFSKRKRSFQIARQITVSSVSYVNHYTGCGSHN
jgi:hypothetical protein